EETLREFGLVECAALGYADRTRANVVDADGTLIVGNYAAGGTALTCEIAKELARPLFLMTAIGPSEDDIEALRKWLTFHGIRTVNVAGNRESVSPGIFVRTRDFLLNSLK